MLAVHFSEWSLVRSLLQHAIDHQNLKSAALARSCAETLSLVQTSEQRLRSLNSAGRLARLKPPKSAALDTSKLPTDTTAVRGDVASFDNLFEVWSAANPDVRERTKRQWRAALLRFKGFVGHDNPVAVTRGDAIRWKMQAIALGSSVATVRCKYIAPPRAMFGAAEVHGLLGANPFQRLGLSDRTAKKRRLRGFTDAEAQTILRAANRQIVPDGKESQATVDLRRWAPWLCAHTGARIGEICQLRQQDLVERDGCWALRLTPEAGSIKTGESRFVPVHPQLIEEGFLDFVNSRPAGMLFSEANATGSRDFSKKVSAWVRSLGVTDDDVHPNHAWRHRFKSKCRQAGIPLEYHDALTGHRNRQSRSHSYGEFPLSALYREICKLPRIGGT